MTFDTLFLDRDGVINQRIIGDYVRHYQDFIPTDGAANAINNLRPLFKHIFVVTNQQGIGRGLMSRAVIDSIHARFNRLTQGSIDKFYICPHLKIEQCDCRKPRSGMAEQAKADYPDIDFKRALMLGDSISDMQMGKSLNMYTVFIGDDSALQEYPHLIDDCYSSLYEWAECYIRQHKK